jgi:hypothetical protein
MKAKVLGMKSSKGTMENGQSYDSTKVYIETRLDESKGNMKGFGVAEYGLGNAAEFDKYKHLPFPFMAEVEYDQVTNGKAQKTIVVALTPIEVVKSAAPAVSGRAP